MHHSFIHSFIHSRSQGGAGGTDQRGSGRKETLEDCQGGTGGTNQEGSSLTRTLEDGQGAGPEGQTRPALTRQEARAEPAAWPAARAAPAGQEAWVQFRCRQGEGAWGAPAGRGAWAALAGRGAWAAPAGRGAWAAPAGRGAWNGMASRP